MAENRRILITGATRGLSRAMDRGFAAQGHHVDGCGRDNAALSSP